MKPDWDKLMDEYKDSKAALVADVDCTEGGKSLCEKHSISGYPAIKYGDPTAMEDYKGGRDFESFKKFAAENLGPTCGPANLDLCDEADLKFIKKFQKWDIDELTMEIEEQDAKVAKVKKAGEAAVEKLQKQMEALEKKIEKEGKKGEAAVAKKKKESGYAFMVAVRASREKKEAGEGKEEAADSKAEL